MFKRKNYGHFMNELFKQLGNEYNILNVHIFTNFSATIIKTQFFTYIDNLDALRKRYPGKYLMIPYKTTDICTAFYTQDVFSYSEPTYATMQIDLYA